MKTDEQINKEVEEYIDSSEVVFLDSLKELKGKELHQRIKNYFYMNELDEVELDVLTQEIKKRCKVNVGTLRKVYYSQQKKRMKEEGFVEEEDKKEQDTHTSLYINYDKKIIAEQIYNNDKVSFSVYTEGESIETKDSIYVGGIELMPFSDQEVIKEAIKLPTEPIDYGSDEKLDQDLKDFITKWLDIPEDILQFSIWNIKRSWVYERFHTLNYLRALGDTGQGKTRFLDTLGHLHYKPISTSGATTSAPIFRIIEKWKGTLIMDEADFSKSDEAQDIIKIINMGYENGKYIMRCNQNDASKIEFFDPYGPKILATRKSFQDKAVESRCITQVMTGTTRDNIKFNLNQDFFDESMVLRNKLLMWRFKNFFNINPDLEIDFELGNLEPRVKQIVNSFISLFSNDKKQLDKFKTFIKNYQDDLVEERRNTFEGGIIEGIFKLLETGNTEFSSKDIIEAGNITNQKGQMIKPRSLTSPLKSLGFKKSVKRRIGVETKRIIPWEKNHLINLFKRYGCDYVSIVTVLGGVGGSRERQNKIGENESLSLTSPHPLVTVTSVTQEQEKIYLKCNVCGDFPSVKYEEIGGKPICDGCNQAKEINKHQETIE